MGQVNGLSIPVVVSPAVQRQQAEDKARQLRRAKQRQSNTDAGDEVLAEPPVDGTGAISGTNDNNNESRQQKKDKYNARGEKEETPDGGDKPTLDLTA